MTPLISVNLQTLKLKVNHEYRWIFLRKLVARVLLGVGVRSHFKTGKTLRFVS